MKKQLLSATLIFSLIMPIGISSALAKTTKSKISCPEVDVYIDEVGGGKLSVVKEVKNITGFSLKNAKKLVDSTPALIQEDIKGDIAEGHKAKLQTLGATVRLVGCEPPSAATKNSKLSCPEVDVYIDEVGGSKLSVVKEVMKITGFNLTNSKKLVDNTPALIQEDIKGGTAEAHKSTLEALGSTVRLVGCEPAKATPNDKSSCPKVDVIIESVGGSKTAVVKTIMNMTGKNLADAKKAVATLPATIYTQIDGQQAMNAKQQLESAGAVIKLVGCEPPTKGWFESLIDSIYNFVTKVIETVVEAVSKAASSTKRAVGELLFGSSDESMSAKKSEQPSPSPSPSASATPSPSPTFKTTAEEQTPPPEPTAEATPKPTPEQTPTPTPEPDPTPTPPLLTTPTPNPSGGSGGGQPEATPEPTPYCGDLMCTEINDESCYTCAIDCGECAEETPPPYEEDTCYSCDVE